MRSAKAQHTAHSVAGGGAPFIISSGMSQFFTTAVGAGIVPAAVSRNAASKKKSETGATVRTGVYESTHWIRMFAKRPNVESKSHTTLKGNFQTSSFAMRLVES